jgi:hypothetical protein
MSDDIVSAPFRVNSTVDSLREEPPRSTRVERADTMTFGVGRRTVVRRLGFGTMRITGEGTWGSPADRGAMVSARR